MDEIIEKYYDELCESENSPFDDLNEEDVKQEIWLSISLYMHMPKKQRKIFSQYQKIHKDRMLRRMWRCYKQGFLKGLKIREEELKK